MSPVAVEAEGDPMGDSTTPRMTGRKPAKAQAAAPAPVLEAVAQSSSNGKDATMAGESKVTKIAAEAVQTGEAKAKSVINEGATQARASMEKGMEQATKAAETMFKAAEEAVEFGRGNIEAVTKSAQLWATGTQDIARQYAALAQGFADHAMESAKAFASVKSLKEATELQTSFAKAAFEKASSETSKFQEAFLRLSESASAPITARVQLAVEKFAKPIAA
ncbi:phasin family protein [Plastoroseomonas hellenica]|nr:phasin family protein [Plastoroseomonas hellenica]